MRTPVGRVKLGGQIKTKTRGYFVKKEPRYVVLRYFFLGRWQIGAPVVMRAGAIQPEVLRKYSKHSLPRIVRPLFSVSITTSDELPKEYRRFRRNRRG